MLLILAALPVLFWDAPPNTAPQLRDAGITSIAVPAAQAESWKAIAGLKVETADPQAAVKLATPAVNNRINQASASRDPWVDSNGWRFLRQPQARFYYDLPGPQSAVAAAEAFSYGANAVVRTDANGLKPFAQMLEFLRTVSTDDMPPVADIGFIDDGSPAAGEVLNLLARNNLLVKLVRAPEPGQKLMVRFGSKDYPLEDAKNPSLMMHVIRGNLTDDKRSVRIYGSSVVIARLTGSTSHLRVQLLNYAGANRKINGLRVRVLGQFPNHKLATAGVPDNELVDFSADSGATEFTVRELQTYAVIDLSR
jgi:hypothetical protein